MFWMVFAVALFLFIYLFLKFKFLLMVIIFPMLLPLLGQSLGLDTPWGPVMWCLLSPRSAAAWWTP